MSRKANPMSVEGMRQAFISELKFMGIVEGRQGQPLDNMDYHSVLNLVTVERIKRDNE
jgi:hypothetical protein